MDITFPEDMDIDPNQNVFGALIQSKCPMGKTAEAAHTFWQAIFEMDPGNPIRIIMPCGSEKVYQSIREIPMVDVRCDCDNKRHWFIKYELEVICDRN